VCVSYLCVGHEAPCKNCWADRDAVWHVEWSVAVGSSNHVLDGGPDPPRERGKFGEGKRPSHIKVPV